MRTTSATTSLRFVGRSALAATIGFTALGFGVTAAGAETPVFQPGVVIAQPETDPQPDPQPQPEPFDIADAPVDPGPDPMPEDDLDIAPTPHPEPDPNGGIDDFANGGGTDPEPGPDGPEDKAPVPNGDDPHPGDGIDDLTAGGCPATHGCEPECHELAASCDLTDGDPGDDTPEDDTPEDDTPETPGEDTPEDDRVLGQSTSTGSLPVTGGGLAVLSLVGAALTGLGAALRRFAGR